VFYLDVLTIHSLLILLFAVAVTAIVTRDPWTEWLRSARSKNWPVVSGTIETGDLSITKNNRGRDVVTTSIGYSCNVDRNYYSGYHIEQFKREQDGTYYIDAQKGRVVQISYDPQKPEISILRNSSG
jgi:hypothetical protein